MQNLELFKNVDLTEYEDLLKPQNVKANTLLFNEGEVCKSLGILISGEIKISTLTAINNEYIINVLHDGNTFGDTLLFADSNTYLGDGITTKDSKILYISNNTLIRLLQNTTILNNYLKLLANKTARINERLKLFSQKSIEDRIIFYLTSESKKINNNTIPITSKEKLANILNIPRPSLSRELINLKNKKIIEYGKSYIKLLKD